MASMYEWWTNKTFYCGGSTSNVAYIPPSSSLCSKFLSNGLTHTVDIKLEGLVVVNGQSKALSLPHSRDNGHIQTNLGGTGYGLAAYKKLHGRIFRGFNGTYTHSSLSDLMIESDQARPSIKRYTICIYQLQASRLEIPEHMYRQKRRGLLTEPCRTPRNVVLSLKDP